ncbi:MAG: transposase [Gemmataceae bacterium]|nr:transposase [Gemmataceae bacterium]
MRSPRPTPDDPAAAPRGWHDRGYLPHFDAGREYTQFVTFRLADAVPESVVAGWQDELRDRLAPDREAALHRLIEAHLDAGHGACRLRELAVGRMVEDAVLHFDRDRYDLHAWVVMPNHVHALFTPAPGRSLSDIVGSWKSFTSKEANKLLGRGGRFWQEDYFDRYVRNEHHFDRVVGYIEANPVKAGLCPAAEDWPLGSARRRIGAAGTAALHGENL